MSTKDKTNKTYTVSQLAVERAKVRGIDTSRAAKEIRSRLRANFDHVCKLDSSVRKAKESANDGNRWPAMNADVRTFILKTNQARANDAAQS
jgi:protein-tyrosine-phosphatase